MNVFVYRSGKKSSWYLYLPDEDNFDKVPEQLLATLKPLELALQFDLHPGRSLARDNAPQVMSDLQEKGYHLQIGDPLIADPLARQH